MGVLRPRVDLRSRTGRFVAALGLVPLSPHLAAAARRSERQNDGQGRDNTEAQDDGASNSGNEQDSDRKSDAKTSDKSGESGKHDRNQQRSANDERSERNEPESEKSRGEPSRRNADSDSTSRQNTSTDDDSHRGDQHGREFEQKADGTGDGRSPANSTTDNVPDTTTTPPSNPNVSIDGVPDTSINDLVVQGNDDVIASVSTSGGFAFARSGDVVAVTGPDGASIIRTGDVSTGTNGTTPTEPAADGGNNNVDFAS